jgi:predicted ABC-type sugar transport system permease subunit
VATTATPPAATSSAPAAIAGKTAGEYSRLGSLALPLLILLGLLSGLLGSLLRYRRAIPAGVAAASRLVRRAGRGGAHR